VVVLAVRGDVDALSAPRLIEAIGTELEAAADALIVDLTDVDFLASAGMTVLLEGHQAAGAKAFAVVADGPSTSRPLKLMGLDQELRLYPTLAAALNDLA
jgi:anti-anti-sigma factor